MCPYDWWSPTLRLTLVTFGTDFPLCVISVNSAWRGRARRRSGCPVISTAEQTCFSVSIAGCVNTSRQRPSHLLQNQVNFDLGGGLKTGLYWLNTGKTPKTEKATGEKSFLLLKLCTNMCYFVFARLLSLIDGNTAERFSQTQHPLSPVLSLGLFQHALLSYCISPYSLLCHSLLYSFPLLTSCFSSTPTEFLTLFLLQLRFSTGSTRRHSLHTMTPPHGAFFS